MARLIIRFIVLGCIFGIGSAITAGCQSSGADTPAALQLFNGKNLDGFYTFLRDRGRENDPGASNPNAVRSE